MAKRSQWRRWRLFRFANIVMWYFRSRYFSWAIQECWWAQIWWMKVLQPRSIHSIADHIFSVRWHLITSLRKRELVEKHKSNVMWLIMISILIWTYFCSNIKRLWLIQPIIQIWNFDLENFSLKYFADKFMPFAPIVKRCLHITILKAADFIRMKSHNLEMEVSWECSNAVGSILWTKQMFSVSSKCFYIIRQLQDVSAEDIDIWALSKTSRAVFIRNWVFKSSKYGFNKFVPVLRTGVSKTKLSN